MDLKQKEELLKKIQELEAGHARLKQEMSDLILSRAAVGHTGTGLRQQRSQSVSPQRRVHQTPGSEGDEIFVGPNSFSLTGRQYLNILQSMGQAVYILDRNDRIIYWNRMAENMYGYTAAEAIGQNVIKLLTDCQDYSSASNIIDKVVKGESWTGIFPVKNKAGKRFQILATDTPFNDDDGELTGLICVASDSQSIQQVFDAPLVANQSEGDSTFRRLNSVTTSKLGLDPQQPLQAAITSQISNLASKITLKVSNNVRSIRTGDSNIKCEGGSGDGDMHRFYHCFEVAAPSNHGEDVLSSGANTPRGDSFVSPFWQFPQEKSVIHSLIVSKTSAEKPGISGSWRGNDPEASERGHTQLRSNEVHNNHTCDLVNQRASSSFLKQESGVGESQSARNINNTSSASSFGSTSSTTLNKLDFENDCLDYEILWEDLTFAEQIGQGSCGIVFHALWYGSDVAVKVFSNQEYSEDLILSFRQEISIMKRLRHPNVLLFMGAVASPDQLCIVTEFLPRGSLFHLLQRNAPKLDWRKRVQMALDIARGMNYLHHFNPPIMHRDLKSSNLLVDRNWTLKVGDFGLSRLKHETYLTTKTGRGTPQWMAPEVLRNEPSDEKSDVYSYGVVLWEIVTQKIPWENHNSIQVVSAVGFMDQRLDIPKNVDPQWASIIESCWHSDPHCRPTFQELLDKLKELQRQHFVRLHSARNGSGNTVQKKCNTD
ncbi:unnamed protein product [Rhodiola kirilowii]